MTIDLKKNSLFEKEFLYLPVGLTATFTTSPVLHTTGTKMFAHTKCLVHWYEKCLYQALHPSYES